MMIMITILMMMMIMIMVMMTMMMFTSPSPLRAGFLCVFSSSLTFFSFAVTSSPWYNGTYKYDGDCGEVEE